MIDAWGVQTSWNRPPKGLLQRIRAHGISESTTTRSRPKSQASHTAKFDSVLLFTQSGTVTQPFTQTCFQEYRGCGEQAFPELDNHRAILEPTACLSTRRLGLPPRSGAQKFDRLIETNRHGWTTEGVQMAVCYYKCGCYLKLPSRRIRKL